MYIPINDTQYSLLKRTDGTAKLLREFSIEVDSVDTGAFLAIPEAAKDDEDYWYPDYEIAEQLADVIYHAFSIHDPRIPFESRVAMLKLADELENPSGVED